MESSNKLNLIIMNILVALLFISLFSISSATTTDPILDPECGYCSKPKPTPKPTPKPKPKPTKPIVDPKLPLPPVTLPPVVPKLPLPPVPKLPVGPVVPKLPLPPVPKLPVGPVVPKLPLPPVPKLPVGPVIPKLPLPPVPKLPVGPVVPKLPLPNLPLPPVTGPVVGPPKGSGKKPCPPPSSGGGPKPATCPIDTLKLGACVDLLGGLVHIGLGDPAVNECCPIISGLAEVEAAACLCTTLKIKALNLKLYVPIALQLLLTCGKTPPPGYTCSI